MGICPSCQRRLQISRDSSSSSCLLNGSYGRVPSDAYDVDTAVLGVGATGTVKVAHCKKTEAVCILKTINKSDVQNPHALQREIQIQSDLDHPNIARIYESYEDRRQIYIIMEMCSGGTLFDVILKDAKFGEVDARHAFKQLLQGVNHMHCKGFAHRDLKPENFLLKEKSIPLNQNIMKIIDFGMSRSFLPEGTCHLNTACGTPYYTAPEVLAGQYNEKCDIWSCGVILYLLLCGEPPFVGATPEDTLKEASKGNPNFDRSEFNGTSASVKALVDQMLQLDPTKRLSAGSALNSEWLQQSVENGTESVELVRSSSVVANLRKFSALSRFKKEALKVITHRLDDKDIASLRDTFMKLDSNGDGMLTLQDFRAGFEETGLNAEELFNEIDTDSSGAIDYTEFLSATASRGHYLRQEACWEAFRVFDQDGDGKISLKELRLMLSKDGLKRARVGYDEAETLLQEADSNGDGFIDFDEFMAMMKR